MHGRIAGRDGWIYLLLAAGGGLVWGLLSLWLGFSWRFAQSRGALRAVLVLLTGPLHVADWLARALGLSVVDPSVLIVATGLALGLAAGAVCAAVIHWRT